MLVDKPKLVFSDISGKVTLEASLTSQQIKQAAKALTPEQQYLKALYTVGEAKQ